ncbi:hypothetical protein I7I50_06231 [Histoplasma capsulatum G186AR]|uniref:Uncharacterized protein n=1 Tax=Ajellomyces capsulatus TaxID=5037 RepID=A0A8H8D3Y0_AJECA|nr:hypothetical protein I7I52_10697 [Histoplasma capsulatum]QSS67218.1 hypothetical protein I7I50_06231 [Histoplasma capsulatum G186AR]
MLYSCLPLPPTVDERRTRRRIRIFAPAEVWVDITSYSHCPVQVNPLEPITARKPLHEAGREVESIFPVFDLEMRNEYGIEG